MIYPCGDGTAAVFTAADVDLTYFTRVKHRKRRGGKRRPPVTFTDMLCAFDIETTDDGEKAFMWGWQFAFLAAPGAEETRTKRGLCLSCREPVVVMGDTWEELQLLLSRISDAAGEGVTVAVYVHSLTYEYHFMRGIIPFTSGFVIGNGKVARLDSPGFEWRCSYCYTNKSLEQWTRGRVKHAKAKGDLDFTVYREPGCEMTAAERGYRYNDVAGLVEALYKEFIAYKETVATCVMTSTGHVRREINRAADKELRDVKWDCEQRLFMAKKLHLCFRGGDTHGNRDQLGIIHHGVTGRDKKSSYPCELLIRKFPVTSFVPIKDLTPEGWHKWAWAANYRSFARLRLTGVAIKQAAPDPYIARAKVQKVSGSECDNGRILYADMVELYLVDLDWRIIEDAYTVEHVEVLEAYTARADYLPASFTRLVREFFRQKELLGARVKKLEKAGDYAAADAVEEERSKFKGLVNSFYGCLAEWLHLEELEYNADRLDFILSESGDTEEHEAEVWQRRNKSRLPYQWGVWTTAWARYDYYKGVKAVCGNFAYSSNWIYGDTDSCKYISTPEIEERFRILNDQIKRDCEAAPVPGYVDIDTEEGTKRVYLGLWEVEGFYTEFRTWGAKKYAYRDKRGLHVTVAGLNKKKGAEYLEKLGGIEAFDRKTVWPEDYSGRTRAVYSEPMKAHTITLRSGRRITSAGFIRLVPTTYTLDITNELLFLLQNIGTIDGLGAAVVL